MIYCRLHCGLGDIIAAAAIINKLAIETGEEIILPCYKHNEESVRSMFVNVPKVKLQLIDFQEGWPDLYHDGKTLSLGHYGTDPQRPDEDFVQWFYRHAAMTYEERKKYCPIREAHERIAQKTYRGEYDFIHDDFDRGFKIEYIPNRTMIRPSKTGSILQYCHMIEHATEIHCIDSSFFHLVESLKPMGNLFYHKNARANSTEYNPIHKWTTI